MTLLLLIDLNDLGLSKAEDEYTKATIHAAEEQLERVDEPDKKSRFSPISLIT